MRPKLLLVDEPCNKAKEIFEAVFDFVMPNESEYTTDFTAIYTQLTPVVTNATVFCPCTGIDHVKSPNVIYLDDTWKQNEGREITSTAEHTWSLILQLAKMKRMQLNDKTIGIIGFGRIGKKVAEYARAFGMNYTAINADVKHFWNEQYDIITLHVPLNESTKGMIGETYFELMKPGTLLINTSRPEIVDKNALINWLQKTGEDNYYADDFEEDRLIFFPNVIQTPHIAGNSIEARESTDIYIANKAIEWWKAVHE